MPLSFVTQFEVFFEFSQAWKVEISNSSGTNLAEKDECVTRIQIIDNMENSIDMATERGSL